MILEMPLPNKNNFCHRTILAGWLKQVRLHSTGRTILTSETCEVPPSTPTCRGYHVRSLRDPEYPNKEHQPRLYELSSFRHPALYHIYIYKYLGPLGMRSTNLISPKPKIFVRVGGSHFTLALRLRFMPTRSEVIALPDP